MTDPRTQRAFASLQHLLPRKLITLIAARFAATRNPWIKHLLITSFIHQFRVDMTEALNPDPKSYACFNDFFTRPLQNGARPLGDSEKFVLSPADGAVSELGRIHDGRIYQAKGQEYTATQLLGGNSQLAEQFRDGDFITVYLSPKDYHRLHMPVTGRLLSTQYIPGDYFSVNRATANYVPGVFARNERMVCVFETDIGKMVFVLVGAMIVAGIETVWGGGAKDGDALKDKTVETIELSAGEEMGRFYLGSTAILLFEKNALSWKPNLQSGAPVQMGQEIGKISC